jgi:hypothetical protein
MWPIGVIGTPVSRDRSRILSIASGAANEIGRLVRRKAYARYDSAGFYYKLVSVSGPYYGCIIKQAKGAGKSFCERGKVARDQCELVLKRCVRHHLKQPRVWVSSVNI